MVGLGKKRGEKKKIRNPKRGKKAEGGGRIQKRELGKGAGLQKTERAQQPVPRKRSLLEEKKRKKKNTQKKKNIQRKKKKKKERANRNARNLPLTPRVKGLGKQKPRGT